MSLTPTKKRWFSLVTILSPFLALLALETALRVFTYGPDLALFTTEEIGGKIFHIMNPKFKNRYFTHVEFNPNSSPDYFRVPKPHGAFRIFVLGGSTTVGYPYWYIGSFSTFLRDLLQTIFPEKNVEVINLGLTATNSYTVLDIAEELVDYEPDMIIVYDGHNEFYGALGANSQEKIAQTRWITRLYLHLIHIRTFLLARSFISSLSHLLTSSHTTEPVGTMMEQLGKGQYVPYGSKSYLNTLEIFEQNLVALKELCRKRGITLLLSSQVSNLRAQSPFVSGFETGKTQSEMNDFNRHYETGGVRFKEAAFVTALAEFESCVALDSLRADAHFQRARCLDTIGRKNEALREYILARDFDQLRFRASTDFNNATHRLADQQTIFFVDVERKFRANSPDSLIGRELILEHLHPTLRGYYLISKAIASTMRQFGILASTSEWESRDTLQDSYYWESRPVTDLDELCAKKRTDRLTSRWPFNNTPSQWNSPVDTNIIGRIAEDIVVGKLTWEQGHVAVAEFYEKDMQFEKAIKEYRAIINQIPLSVSAYLRMARIFLTQSDYEQAWRLLHLSLNIEPTLFANRTLGSLAARRGLYGTAIPFMEDAYALSLKSEEKVENGYILALTLRRAGNPGRAISLLREILAINPKFSAAHELLRQLQE